MSVESIVNRIAVSAAAGDRQRTAQLPRAATLQPAFASVLGNALPQPGKALPEAVTANRNSNVVTSLASHVQRAERELSFTVDSAGLTAIRVIDTPSRDVIRRISSEDIVSLARYQLDAERERGGLLEVRA